MNSAFRYFGKGYSSPSKNVSLSTDPYWKMAQQWGCSREEAKRIALRLLFGNPWEQVPVSGMRFERELSEPKLPSYMWGEEAALAQQYPYRFNVNISSRKERMFIITNPPMKNDCYTFEDWQTLGFSTINRKETEVMNSIKVREFENGVVPYSTLEVGQLFRSLTERTENSRVFMKITGSTPPPYSKPQCVEVLTGRVFHFDSAARVVLLPKGSTVTLTVEG